MSAVPSMNWISALCIGIAIVASIGACVGAFARQLRDERAAQLRGFIEPHRHAAERSRRRIEQRVTPNVERLTELSERARGKVGAA